MQETGKDFQVSRLELAHLGEKKSALCSTRYCPCFVALYTGVGDGKGYLESLVDVSQLNAKISFIPCLSPAYFMHVVLGMNQWHGYADPREAIGNEWGTESAGDEILVPNSTSVHVWEMEGTRYISRTLACHLQKIPTSVFASLVLFLPLTFSFSFSFPRGAIFFPLLPLAISHLGNEQFGN